MFHCFLLLKQFVRGLWVKGTVPDRAERRAAPLRPAVLWGIPWPGNRQNRPHQRGAPAPTAIPNHPTTFSSARWGFSGHAPQTKRSSCFTAHAASAPQNLRRCRFFPAVFWRAPPLAF